MINLRHLLYGGVFLVTCVACREENLVGSVPEMSDHILFDNSLFISRNRFPQYIEKCSCSG